MIGEKVHEIGLYILTFLSVKLEVIWFLNLGYHAIISLKYYYV